MLHPIEKWNVNVVNGHQAELRREEKCTDQKPLNISSLQTDYLNIDSSSGSSRNSERAHAVQTKCTFFGGSNHSAEKCFKRIKEETEKLMTTAYKSKTIKFKMDEDPLQCRIYHLTFVESLEIIFSQYTKTCEVL